jgi:LuxR family maltose regulon positive regulatory protein
MLITAPAGYGKTVLMSQWHDHLVPSRAAGCWISLDDEDNDLLVFVAHLAGAIAESRPSFDGNSIGPMRRGLEIELNATIEQLIGEFAEVKDEFFLFLDDLHRIHHSGVLRFLTRLIERSSAAFKLVIAARESPRLHLAQLQARGQLHVVGLEELSFSAREATAFLSRHRIPAIADELVNHLIQATEGWAVGLQLACIALENTKDARAFVENFTGRNKSVSAFLDEDVFDTKDAPTREFLLKTSIMDRLCADNCNALLGRSDSDAILARLRLSNTPLFALDAEGSWYRYHKLFQEYLQEKLAAEYADQATTLYQTASRWFREQGSHADALALAWGSGDSSFVAETLEAACREYVHDGRFTAFTSAVSRLPREILVQHPHLALYQVWVDEMTLNFDEGSRLLAAVEEALARDDERKNSIVDADTGMRVQEELLHRRMMLALHSDDCTLAKDLSDKWLSTARSADPYVTATVYSSRILAGCHLFDLEGFAASGEKAREMHIREGHLNGTVWHDCIMGLAYETKGDLQRAEEDYSTALRTAETIHDVPSRLSAMPSMFLAQLFYERNECNRATDFLETHSRFIGEIGLADQFFAGMATRANLWMLEGRHDEAVAILEKGIDFAQSRNLGRIVIQLAGERIRQALSMGRIDDAIEVGKQHGVVSRWVPEDPAPRATTREYQTTLAWCRLEMLQGDLAPVLSVLRKWMIFCRRRQCDKLAIKAAVLLARAYLQRGNLPEALRVLKQAVVDAARFGMVRTFMDEGMPIHGLLKELLRPRGQFSASETAFLERLTSSQPGADAQCAVDACGVDGVGNLETTPLTAREAELLTLVARGLKGRFIACELGISEGMVKWHMQRIFNKVGVRGRDAAVLHARRLGYIR